MCLTGASWVQQQILTQHPSADLRVYAIWTPTLPTDARSKWDDRLLTDPRVTHLWDGHGVAGRWFADPENLGLRYPGPVMWDAFLLFDRQARWDQAPSHLVGAGWTVIGSTDKLKTAMEPLLIEAGTPTPGSARPESGTPPSTGSVAVIATGLTNPRGFAFGPNGALAGTSGPNAGVVAIKDGCPSIIASGFPAYRVVFGGLSGVADVAYLDGQLYALLAGGDIDHGGRHNGLYRLDSAGGATLVADVSAFIRDHPVAERPRDYDTDGQPYAMLPLGDAVWVTEGNSNQILRVGLDGTVTRIADLSHGHPIPTGMAPAPNGGAYIAFFTHAPYDDGAAKVVRVAADGTVTDVWTGLTLVTALAVGSDDTLNALEMATGIDPADPASIRPGTGKVVRQTGPDAAEDVVTGLALPAAMEIGPDGALDVASPTFGADDGQGTILRVDVSAGQPVAIPTVLPLGPACATR